MRHIRKAVCLWLSAWILCSCVIFPAEAVADPEDPLAVKNFAEFGAPAPIEEEPAARNGVPEEEETEPEEETIPEEETEPEYETEPEEETDPEEETEPEDETEPEEETDPEDWEEDWEEEFDEESDLEEEYEDETEEEEDEWVPHGHNGVPLYFQTDYPNNMYGIGTIASNGCSVTSLAMVATYMTGHEYLPDELARYFGGAAENNIARLEQGSETLQLPFYKADNWHRTREAIHDGKIAIVLMNRASIFTQSQHFIIVTGMTEDGKYLVNDSYEPNYDKWDLKQGFREGFPESAIIQGYSGAWVYDKEALPEEPFIYSKPLPVRGEPRYDIELTLEERKLLAKVVWVEARGECMEGQQAVAEVVLNRMSSDKFPDLMQSVIYAEGQFRSAPHLDKAMPYQMQYEAIENALYGPYVLPKDVYYFATTPTNDNVWGQIGGHIFCYSPDWIPKAADATAVKKP